MAGPAHLGILVVASHNAGKVREIRELLHDLPIEVVSLGDLPDPPQLNESHDTFAANATQKATAAARASGHLALADDSGLVVPALDGAPGVHSSRIAGTDAERIAWLLVQMCALTGEQRAAYFLCAVALTDSKGNVLGTWEGRVDGVIATAPKGTDGFGYDPVFWYPPAQRTFAQMNPEQKNQVSHRGHALRAFARDMPDILAHTTSSRAIE